MPRDLEQEPLTEQEILDLAASNPRIVKRIQDADPRAQLQEMFMKSEAKYGDRPLREVIEEMGVLVAPDSNLARTRKHVRAEMAPLVEENKKLAKELRDATTVRREAEFDASLKTYARELDAEISDEETGEIRKFMTDNQFGPAAAKYAVGVWLESKRPAEPSYEPAVAWPTGDDEHSKALLAAEKAGDDLGPNTPRGINHAEKVWHSMFGKDRRFASPAFSVNG